MDNKLSAMLCGLLMAILLYFGGLYVEDMSNHHKRFKCWFRLILKIINWVFASLPVYFTLFYFLNTLLSWFYPMWVCVLAGVCEVAFLLWATGQEIRQTTYLTTFEDYITLSKGECNEKCARLETFLKIMARYHFYDAESYGGSVANIHPFCHYSFLARIYPLVVKLFGISRTKATAIWYMQWEEATRAYLESTPRMTKRYRFRLLSTVAQKSQESDVLANFARGPFRQTEKDSLLYNIVDNIVWRTPPLYPLYELVRISPYITLEEKYWYRNERTFNLRSDLRICLTEEYLERFSILKALMERTVGPAYEREYVPLIVAYLPGRWRPALLIE